MTKTVSLVLGSGGARGLAHIGIIKWLEENNYKIQSISGCSMGALVGGIYAAGKLDEYEHWARAITDIDIIRLMDLSWSKSGILKGDKVINTLIELVGDQDIETLPIKYTAVAADIVNEKEVWINKGSEAAGDRRATKSATKTTFQICWTKTRSTFHFTFTKNLAVCPDNVF